jgi:predicted membrane protein
MTNYFRHLLRLYFAYMKLALVGMGVSTLVLVFSAAIRTDNLFIGFTIALLSAAIIVSFAIRYYRKKLEKEFRDADLARFEEERPKVRQQFEQEGLELEQRFGQETLELEQLRAESLRRHLSSEPLKTINFQDAVLVHELAILIEQLERLNLDGPSIDDAIQRFLDMQEHSQEKTNSF